MSNQDFCFVRCGAILYFCLMSKWCVILSLTWLTVQGFGQIRLDKLEINTHQTYSMAGSNVLVVDTLIMRDSSCLMLHKEKSESIINVKVLIVNIGAKILGYGVDGKAGKVGSDGFRQGAPCRVGGNASEGAVGGNGSNGRNLSLYVNQLVITGSLTINFSPGSQLRQILTGADLPAWQAIPLCWQSQRSAAVRVQGS